LDILLRITTNSGSKSAVEDVGLSNPSIEEGVPGRELMIPLVAGNAPTN
jgi:hypothetical protein